jgi:mTERF domain-containing protein
MNAVMNFWVNHLGFDSLDLARAPGILQLSLEKRIIPRGLVVQFLNSKGLRQKDASIHTPFRVSEKLFLEKFVNRFAEHSSDLLKLYEEKMNLGDSRNGLQMV